MPSEWGDDCDELSGDTIDRVATWQGEASPCRFERQTSAPTIRAEGC